MSAGTLIDVQHVTKKYCRNFKRSLWYGVKDVCQELTGRSCAARTKLRRDEFLALDDVSFQLKRGECVGVIGPNGAGKSTLLKLLNGLIKPDAGCLRLRGRVGALIELGTGFNPLLTGRENIYAGGAVLGMKKREIDQQMDEIVAFAEVDDFLDAPFQSYSSGMRVRLGFAVAAHLRPNILLIDEVLAVGDVSFRMKCYQHILKLLDHGTSIILVTHNVNHLTRVTDRALVLAGGKKQFEGPLSDAIASYHASVGHQVSAEHDRCEEHPEITSVQLLDGNGAPQTDFRTGETIRARITLSTDRPFGDGRLIAAIEAPEFGALGSVSTPYSGFTFEIAPPQTVVELAFDHVPLLAGTYHLVISLFGPQMTDFYDRRLPAATFRITGPPTNAFGYGLYDHIHFEHHWEQK